MSGGCDRRDWDVGGGPCLFVVVNFVLAIGGTGDVDGCLLTSDERILKRGIL